MSHIWVYVAASARRYQGRAHIALELLHQVTCDCEAVADVFAVDVPFPPTNPATGRYQPMAEADLEGQIGAVVNRELQFLKKGTTVVPRKNIITSCRYSITVSESHTP